MTIFVRNVNWSQSQAEIFLNIPITGNKKSLNDVVLDEKFLKISVRPYFYELFFEHPIQVDQSSCTILESNIKFRLKKVSAEWWSSLGKTASDNDTIPIERKREILDEYEKRTQEYHTQKHKERSNLKRNVVEQEIERENQIRQQIDETESAFRNLQLLKNKESDGPIERTSASNVCRKSEQLKTDLPPIRSRGNIDVYLSCREFVTPKRESLEHAEREWCAKQHEIMVKHMGFSDKDLNSDERDVNWVLKKGHDFLEKKNYLAAVSAFSFGLRMSNDLPELLLGRAKAQYALRNFKRCAEDCSDALEKFKPAVQSNLLSRIHCYWLRGKSLIALGFKEYGEREIQLAMQLDPSKFNDNESNFIIDT